MSRLPLLAGVSIKESLESVAFYTTAVIAFVDASEKMHNSLLTTAEGEVVV